MKFGYNSLIGFWEDVRNCHTMNALVFFLDKQVLILKYV